MASRSRILVLIALSLAGCDSCGCGERAPAPKRQAQAGAAASGAPAVAGDEDGGVDPHKWRRNQLTPMTDSEERRELESAAARIDTERDLGDPIAAATLAKALPDELDDYEASGAATTSTTPAELGSATVALRRYTQGKAVMHVKITDTADAPGLRAELVPQLTSVGNMPTGDQIGVLQDGIPGVRAYHASINASRALALIEGRFFVEAVVDGAIEPHDAWMAITELDADVLTEAAKAARSKKKR